MGEMGPDCIRCGLCCIAAPCSFEPLRTMLNGVCGSLHVNDDLTTTCMDKNAVSLHVGPGCFIRGVDVRNDDMCLYDLHLEMYDIESAKKCILERQKKVNDARSKQSIQI